MTTTNDRLERFRELTLTNVRYARDGRDYAGAARDFYLHLHERKLPSGLITVEALDVKRPAKEHYYRPQKWFDVFVAEPSLIHDEVFPIIYEQLSQVAYTTTTQNQLLKRFDDLRTKTLYEAAGFTLIKKVKGRHYKNGEVLDNAILPVPDFMDELEVRYLDRI